MSRCPGISPKVINGKQCREVIKWRDLSFFLSSFLLNDQCNSKSPDLIHSGGRQFRCGLDILSETLTGVE